MGFKTLPLLLLLLTGDLSGCWRAHTLAQRSLGQHWVGSLPGVLCCPAHTCLSSCPTSSYNLLPHHMVHLTAAARDLLASNSPETVLKLLVSLEPPCSQCKTTVSTFAEASIKYFGMRGQPYGVRFPLSYFHHICTMSQNKWVKVV